MKDTLSLAGSMISRNAFSVSGFDAEGLVGEILELAH